jgi:hypothetical protein
MPLFNSRQPTDRDEMTPATEEESIQETGHGHTTGNQNVHLDINRNSSYMTRTRESIDLHDEEVGNRHNFGGTNLLDTTTTRGIKVSGHEQSNQAREGAERMCSTLRNTIK